MAARVALFVYQEGFVYALQVAADMYTKSTYPNRRVVGYPTGLVRDACRMLYCGKRIERWKAESRRRKKTKGLDGPVGILVAHKQAD
jgi:hypothetical protein